MSKLAAHLRLFVLIACFPAALHGQASAGSGPGASAPCPDPLAILRAFYDSNDARHFDASMRYLADDAVFATWATGVNGYIMVQRRLHGKTAIRSYLADARGVRWHLPDSPQDGPIYHETRISVSGDTVQFMLEPDRKRLSGRPYNPFKVEARVNGCKIESLTVVEQVTWL